MKKKDTIKLSIATVAVVLTVGWSIFSLHFGEEDKSDTTEPNDITVVDEEVTNEFEDIEEPAESEEDAKAQDTVETKISETEKPPKNRADGEMYKSDLSILQLDGENFYGSHYEKENIIISFFGSTCPYCTDQAKIFEEYRDKLDYEVFYVPFLESYEVGSEHLIGLDLGIDEDRILEDPEFTFATQFHLQATPTNLFSNQNTNVVKGLVGLTSGALSEKSDKEFLEDLFELLSNEK